MGFFAKNSAALADLTKCKVRYLPTTLGAPDDPAFKVPTADLAANRHSPRQGCRLARQLIARHKPTHNGIIKQMLRHCPSSDKSHRWHMIKSDLVQIIASQNRHLYPGEVDRIVTVVFEEIAEALAQGDRVELRGFGVFSVRHRPPRAARNPMNGDTVFVEEKWVPFFRAGKEIQERLNRQGLGIEKKADTKQKRWDF